MKLTVKTLKGEKFDVQVEESNTVEQVKTIIESQKSDLAAATQKLIHSGKILKDADTIASCNIKENDFLVVMVSKPKKPTAPKVETKETDAATASIVPEAQTDGPTSTPKNASTDAAATSASSDTVTPAATTTVATPAAPAPSFSDEVVSNLMGMGFPEAEVRHCLRAAHGNPDIAVEFLTNGIPDGVAEAADLVQASSRTPAAPAASQPSSSTTTSSSGAAPLQALRNHPQFDALRRLVQSNPAMLQNVLTQIGQQQPELLAEINANQAEFLRMMNEPITESRSISGTSSGRSSTGAAPSAGGGMMGMDGGFGGDPAQMAQLIQGMSEPELQQMAQMMGLSVEQLRATAQMIGQMPADQLNQFMMQAMQGGGGGRGGAQFIQLTEEEMAAVDRLAEMGFDRSEAAQAFLACDKNEALAANFLMDSMGEGGGGFFMGDDDNGNGDNDGNADDDDDDENMYD